MKRMLIIAVALFLVAAWPRATAVRGIRIGSKKFTESVIIGEMLAQLAEASGEPAMHLAEFGGTQIVFDALRRGEIDVYPEYTGTIRQEIYAGRGAETPEQLAKLLEADGVAVSGSLGFSNPYALAVRRSTAERLQLKTIGDLVRYPDLKFGFSNEFLDRADGWKNVQKVYRLPQEPTGMDHDLAYVYLEQNSIDVTDVYATDAPIVMRDLVLLEDDRHCFPEYEAVLLSRLDLSKRHPTAANQFKRLAGTINQERMRKLNTEVESHTLSEPQAAARFLLDEFAITSDIREDSVARQIWQRTWEHLDLVRRSLIPAIFLAVPLGVLAAKLPKAGHVILGLTGVVQTVPALALLVLLIPPVAYLHLETVGAGSATAIIALFLYSLLPIVQNTAAGISGIAPEYRESATALGLAPWFRLLHVEFPLAAPSILAGVKTAAVLNVGFATLGALVGARGYGQPILSGIRVNDMGLILQGAIPAAALAILLQIAFEFSERWFIPAGLRLATPKNER